MEFKHSVATFSQPHLLFFSCEMFSLVPAHSGTTQCINALQPSGESLVKPLGTSAWGPPAAAFGSLLEMQILRPGHRSMGSKSVFYFSKTAR